MGRNLFDITNKVINEGDFSNRILGSENGYKAEWIPSRKELRISGPDSTIILTVFLDDRGYIQLGSTIKNLSDLDIVKKLAEQGLNSIGVK